MYYTVPEDLNIMDGMYMGASPLLSGNPIPFIPFPFDKGKGNFLIIEASPL